MSAYDKVAGGALKLKGVSDSGLKKKKKKKNKKEKEARIIEQINTDDQHSGHVKVEIRKTKAEMTFEKTKEKRAEQELLQKGSKSYKERIMELNTKLDDLTEHFDIPKVSWTK